MDENDQYSQEITAFSEEKHEFFKKFRTFFRPFSKKPEVFFMKILTKTIDVKKKSCEKWKNFKNGGFHQKNSGLFFIYYYFEREKIFIIKKRTTKKIPELTEF